jgi:hypothetical protein
MREMTGAKRGTSTAAVDACRKPSAVTWGVAAAAAVVADVLRLAPLMERWRVVAGGWA